MTQNPPPPFHPGLPPSPGPAPGGWAGGAPAWAPPGGMGMQPVSPPPRVPDPGSRRAGFLAKVVLLPALLLVMVMQQVGIYAETPRKEGAPAVEPRGGEDPALLMARIFVKLREAWPAMAGGGEPLQSMDGQWREHEATPDSDRARAWMAAMDARRYELESAVVSAEFVGPGDAVERLDRLLERLDADERKLEELDSRDEQAREDEGAEPAKPGTLLDRALAELGPTPEEARRRAGEVIPILREDARLFLAHFAAMDREARPTGRQADAGFDARPWPSLIDQSDGGWDALKDRHGWYAELARVVGAPASDPERSAMLGGGGALLWFLLVVVGGLGVVALASVGAGIWVVVNLLIRTIRPWFVAPRVGGSVYLETVALFVVAFLGVQVLAGLLVSIPGLKGFELEVSIGTQWLLLLVPLWPLVRGVSVAQWRRDLGLIAPRGVLREVGAGLIVYFAGLPLLVVLGLVGALVLKPVWDGVVEEHVPYTTGGNPVLELVTNGGVVQLVLVYTLATVWAPIVEEVIFRGCLYRHLRSRLPLVLAGPLSALAFGIMHGYEIVLLGPVIALGFTFACMREWRGSLVGPIVMHALHNGTVLLMLIVLMRLVG